MFEHRHQPIMPRHQYVRRQLRSLLVACAIVVAALMPGVAGYHWFEDQTWIDSLLNASMILSSMGPIDHPHTTAGKLFASTYALFSGIVFIVVATIVVAPFAHRILHHFHVATEGDIDDADHDSPQDSAS